jgi:phage portal protein BeeE
MANNLNPSFWSSFFGTDNKRFINPFNNLFQNRIWGQKTAVWIDCTNAYKHYIEIPELRTVIDKRASMMASNVPILYDANGKRIEKHWFLDLVANPNPTQSWKDVIYSLSVNDALWANAFAYTPKRSFDIRNLIVPLPSDKVQINLSGRKLKQMDKDGLIDNFTFDYDSDVETLPFEDVLYLATADGVNLINPSSKLESLRYPLSNIKATYNKRNVLLENIGAIGILSAKNSDIGGSIPMSPEEKSEIQKSWFRRSKDEVIITESDVSWNPMSYPTKDLMLFEELNADFRAIIDAYGLNVNLFSTEKGATFSNVRDSIKMVYTDTIIPETQQMYDSMANQFGLSEEGITIEADFSHIPSLQVDELAKADSMNKRADVIKKITESGVILSNEEIAEIVGY